MRLCWAFLVVGLPLIGLPLVAADIAVAPQALTFAYQFRSPLLPPPQGVVLTSPSAFTFTLSRPAADGWILLPSGSATVTGTGPLFVQVVIDPGVLSPGTYTSAITIRTTQGTVNIPLTLRVSTPEPVLAAATTGGSGIVGFDPAVALLQLQLGMSNGQPFGVDARTTTEWLTVRGAFSPLLVAADPARAGPALRAGSVQITALAFPPPVNNPLTVPVVHLGTGFASPGPLRLSPDAVAFTGSGSQQVAVTGGAFTAASDAAWLTAAVAGQTLTLTANAAGLEAAAFQATVVLNSGGVLQMLPVCLTLGTPALSKVVNAASYAEGAVAPGQVVLLGGSNIGPCVLTGLKLDENGFVSPTLAGVQVTFNGVAAPLIYVTATQVAAVAPYEIDGRAAAAVQVTVGGRASNTLTVPVAAAAPGIFTADASGTGPAAAFRTGDVVSIYLTGEGQTTPAGVTGKVTATPPLPRQSVTATLDGQPVEVLFAGEAPGVVSGVMQVNLRVPPTARNGALPLAVSVGGTPAQTGVTLSVR